MTAREWKKQWQGIKDSRWGGRLLKGLRFSVTFLVVAYLINKLIAVGWKDVWEARPRTIWFYIFGLLVYFSIPLTEMIIYRLLWRHPMHRHFPAFMKKRIYNQDVMGYSGEVYFISWAQGRFGLSLRKVAETVRDNNIISSLASTAIAATLIGLFLSIGKLSLDQLLNVPEMSYVLLGILILAILFWLAIRYRKYLFSMPARLASLVFAIQCGRLLLGQILRIAQWSVALPDVPLQIWFSLAAASLVVSRIPFIPSQDLVFLGVGVEMSSLLGISEVAMFGMLAVSSAVDKLLNAVQFVFWSIVERR